MSDEEHDRNREQDAAERVRDREGWKSVRVRTRVLMVMMSEEGRKEEEKKEKRVRRCGSLPIM